ncbi:hypothetical protein NZD89_14590 [Alicyclobacillus fastidiosus]|uniref:Uncharacterized protein n=1 Tax=Alicyclobacillus fastidiosus TaxID=392011 RepID=A0ABY6Z9W8_9BACL|nr:hypothetical protein [Alicyclobacillus fastidiosus]WAH39646.1 hypothetical protein NZD89_14590 [Alicyclobacillus fastidiosus]
MASALYTFLLLPAVVLCLLSGIVVISMRILTFISVTIAKRRIR